MNEWPNLLLSTGVKEILEGKRTPAEGLKGLMTLPLRAEMWNMNEWKHCCQPHTQSTSISNSNWFWKRWGAQRLHLPVLNRQKQRRENSCKHYYLLRSTLLYIFFVQRRVRNRMTSCVARGKHTAPVGWSIPFLFNLALQSIWLLFDVCNKCLNIRRPRMWQLHHHTTQAIKSNRSNSNTAVDSNGRQERMGLSFHFFT